MKKTYPVIALIFFAWLFSSCGESQTQEKTKPGVVAPVTPSPASPAQASPAPQESIPTQASPAPTIDASTTALEVAMSLQIRGRAPETDYSREAFGTAWKDIDRNGCDTRNDILQRDFQTTLLKNGGCKVIGGTWTDPYSNESYTFDAPPSGAQIDHVVSLKNAWVMGADQWAEQPRVEFANDPLNLRVTVASLNQQKSDSNAASWLPPYKPGRCLFIATQVAVKSKWRLFVTEPEKEVFINTLSKPECAQVKLPN